MSSAEKERQPLRRLERRARHPPPPRLPLRKKGPRLHHQTAQRRRLKKSPRLGSARAVLEALAEAFPRRNHTALVARELAQLVGQVPVHHLTQLHLVTLVSRWKQQLARNTVYGRAVALRRVLRYYVDTTHAHSLALTVPRVPGVQARTIIATPDELVRLHNAAEPLMRIWLRICIALALGQAEATTLSAAHYDAEHRAVTFTRKKTARSNTLPVPDDLAAIFEAAPDFGDTAMPFLQRYNNGRTLSANAARERWQRLKKKAGVRPILIPHDLRRTTAHALQLQTHDITLVQALLGHATLNATAHYTQSADPERLRPLLAQLWKPITEVKQ